MRSHLRRNAHNKRSLRKAAQLNPQPTVPARDEQRLDTDYDPDPALERAPLKSAPPSKTR